MAHSPRALNSKFLALIKWVQTQLDHIDWPYLYRYARHRAFHIFCITYTTVKPYVPPEFTSQHFGLIHNFNAKNQFHLVLVQGKRRGFKIVNSTLWGMILKQIVLFLGLKPICTATYRDWKSKENIYVQYTYDKQMIVRKTQDSWVKEVNLYFVTPPSCTKTMLHIDWTKNART